MDQQEQREAELRELGNKAWMERSGGGGGGGGGPTSSTSTLAAAAGTQDVSNLPAWITKRDGGKEVADLLRLGVVDYLDNENYNDKSRESITQQY